MWRPGPGRPHGRTRWQRQRREDNWEQLGHTLSRHLPPGGWTHAPTWTVHTTLSSPKAPSRHRVQEKVIWPCINDRGQSPHNSMQRISLYHAPFVPPFHCLPAEEWETVLVRLAARYLNDPTANPYGGVCPAACVRGACNPPPTGSVPNEKLQSVLSTGNPDRCSLCRRSIGIPFSTRASWAIAPRHGCAFWGGTRASSVASTPTCGTTTVSAW